jgi:hypothetical protein
MTLRSTRDASRGRILSATAILALLLLAQAADFASAGSKASAFTDDDDDEAYDPDDVEEEVKHTFKPREQPKPQKSPGRVKAALEAEDSENWDPDEFEGFEKPAAPPPKREKKAPGSGARGLQAQPPRSCPALLTPLPVWSPARGAGPRIPCARGKRFLAPLRSAPNARRLRRELKDLIVEIIFMVLLAVYFVLYFIGRSQNTTVAERFLAAVGDTLEDQFALVGAYGELRWERDGPSCFKLYCSGRLNCEKLNMTLDLKPRQAPRQRPVHRIFLPSYSPREGRLSLMRALPRPRTPALTAGRGRGRAGNHQPRLRPVPADLAGPGTRPLRARGALSSHYDYVLDALLSYHHNDYVLDALLSYHHNVLNHGF